MQLYKAIIEDRFTSVFSAFLRLSGLAYQYLNQSVPVKLPASR